MMSENYAMDNVIELGQEYFFLSFKDNYINKLNCKSLQVERIMRIPLYENSKELEYSKMYIYKKKAFVLPWFADDIAVCNLESGNVGYIKVSERGTTGLQYLEAIQLENLLYLVPCGNSDILIIDMEEEVVIKQVSVSELLLKTKDEIYSWGGIFIDNENIIMPLMYSKQLLKYNIETNKLDLCSSVDESVTGWGGVGKTKSGKWYIPKSATQIYFETDKGLKILDNFPVGYKPGEISFYKCIAIDEVIYLLPRDANMMLAINENGEIHKLCEIYHDGFNMFKRYMYFSNVWKMGKSIYCIESNGGRIYEINDNTLVEREIFTEQKINREVLDISSRYITECEWKGFTLNNFIYSLLKQ